MSELLSIDAVRAHFPNAPHGYFDHAAVGAVPHQVSRSVARVAEALEGGMRGSRAWHEITDLAEPLMSEDFGVPADRIGVLANTSTAFNSIARAIPFAPGDEVLIFADDFPSPRMPWPAIAGLTLTEVSVPHGTSRTQALIAALTPNTRAVSVTHVHATTGETLDLQALSTACQTHGALLLVDGTQAAGLLGGAAAHADAYVGASYKWMLAGFGAAVVATSERFDAQAVPGLIGYMNAPPSPKLAVGHSNLYCLGALVAGAQVRHELGAGAIYAHTRSLVAQIERAATAFGFTPDAVHREAGIISLAAHDPGALSEALADRGITVAVRDGRLRVSPYVTTTAEDVQRLIAALEELSPTHRSRDAHPDLEGA